MAGKALMVVGQKRFVQTMRKAGADMDDLKEVNREAAQIALPAGRKAVPYAGPINYGWPKRHIRPRLFVNNGVASTESQWQKVYKDFIDKTLHQVKGK